MIRVLSSVTDPRLGGPQRRIISVAEKLRNRGIEVEVVVPDGKGKFVETAKESGLNTHIIKFSRLRSPNEIYGNLQFFRDFLPAVNQVSKIIGDRNIDLVHANMVVNFQTAFASVLSNTPLAWHFNDTLTPTPVKQVASWLGNHWADELIVAADAVHDYYFDSKTPSRTIYAPVNIDRFNLSTVSIDEKSIRSDLGIRPDVPVVGTVGNINPIKGHKYLLQAISEIVDNGRNIAVPIVGSKLKSRHDYFEGLCDLRAELDLENTVEFVGFRSDIPEILSLFDVFVLPSIAEACPMVVLEAMAMKCPVVATDVGGVPEEIPDDDHGWIVPPKDSTTLAAAIQTVLDNPDEGHRRAENARDRVESEFSLTACVDRHESLYRSMVDES